MKQKIGAILIGMMFLLSLMAVAVNADAGSNKVILGPATGSENADLIKLFEGSTQVGERSTVSGTTYFYLAYGTYKAEAYQSGDKKTEVSFTVSSTSNPIVLYNIVTSANHAPVAAFTQTESGLTVNVDASTSTDADGDALAYSWDFGDSATGTGVTASHTYAAAGTYTITLTVTDSHGATNTVQSSVDMTVQTTSVVYVKDFNFKDTAAPGAEVKFELELKNNATYDAEDVTATITIKGIGADKDNLDTDVDFGAIDSGDKQTETVYITMPQDANDKDYDVVVDLEWKDSDGNKYSYDNAIANQTITIEKVKHQISITSVQMDEAKYKAGDTVQLAVSLLDTGANDETATIKATSDIGVSVASASMKLKEGDATTQYLSFVIPKDTEAGKYFVVVSTNYGSYTASKTIILEVASAEQPTTVTVVHPSVTGGATGLGVPATEIALAIVIVLLIGAIAWMGKDLIKSPKPRPIAVRSKVFK